MQIKYKLYFNKAFLKSSPQKLKENTENISPIIPTELTRNIFVSF